MPFRGSAEAAGYDIHALNDAYVPAFGRAIIDTGLAFAIPKGNYGRLASRSGLAIRHALEVGAGVIDSDYRGSTKVLLFNQGNKDVKLKA